MGLEILLLVPLVLFPLWLWIGKPITREARRQLQAEKTDLREKIRQCEEQLAKPEVAEEARRNIEAVRDEFLLRLKFLETKVEAR